MHHLAGAIAAAPENPEPYAVLAELWADGPSELAEVVQGADSLRTVLARSYISFLEGDMDGAAMAIGSVTGVRPDIASAEAPWFSDARFLGGVSADALAEAAMRTMDYDHGLDTESMRERFRPGDPAAGMRSHRCVVRPLRPGGLRWADHADGGRASGHVAHTG
ncbi:hypothetical protein [Streptomyces olivaceoviridis]|uniref:hypothetical protein n=1 Tax=Streptomyces olivaceoviridis TaxID=1921 RepID=UPI0027E4F80A|nr:hypothetical protein [Streptomyces olivaceoviridis]